jgi:hypothetical protein
MAAPVDLAAKSAAIHANANAVLKAGELFHNSKEGRDHEHWLKQAVSVNELHHIQHTYPAWLVSKIMEEKMEAVRAAQERTLRQFIRGETPELEAIVDKLMTKKLQEMGVTQAAIAEKKIVESEMKTALRLFEELTRRLTQIKEVKDKLTEIAATIAQFERLTTLNKTENESGQVILHLISTLKDLAKAYGGNNQPAVAAPAAAAAIAKVGL